MIGADFSETEARLDRVMDFIRDTVDEAHVSEPAGRGAGWSVDYDEAAIRSFIMEVMVGVALPLPPVGSPADVIGYCWEVKADHPRLEGKPYQGGGPRVFRGQRSAVFYGEPFKSQPWGLTQIWVMRNGQEVRATWKDRP